MNIITTTHPVHSELKNNYYAVIANKDIHISAKLKQAKEQFEASWGSLEKDHHLKYGKSFRYRKFRYLYFSPITGKIIPFAPTAYYQPPEINQYAQGVDRQFETMADAVNANPFFHELIKFDFTQLPVESHKKSAPWLLDIHQIRIITTEAESGEPTPEGIHHDENDFVSIHLIQRENVIGGLNTIHYNDTTLLASYTLTENMDSIILCDPKVMHGVTAIHPKNTNKIAFRDALLIGFSHTPKLQLPTGNTDIDYQEIKKNINPPALLQQAIL
jgi:hypothetical protein